MTSHSPSGVGPASRVPPLSASSSRSPRSPFPVPALESAVCAVAGPLATSILSVCESAQEHPDSGAGGVAQRVGQAFLDDSVGGMRDWGGQSFAFALQPQRHGQAASRCARDELLDEREVGRGTDPLSVAQQRDEPPHVLLRLASGA